MKLACRMIGRNPENPKSRKKSVKVQMIEINVNPDISNCLTTVIKDYLVLEKTDEDKS